MYIQYTVRSVLYVFCTIVHVGVSVTAHARLTRVNSQCTGTMDKENLPPSQQKLVEKDQPPSKKAKLSLSLKKKRFGDSVSSELVTLTTPHVPKNTAKNTEWAIRNFMEWRQQREKDYPEERCRPDIFDSTPWNVAELNHWLCLYVLETRRTDGKRYPISTVYQLLTGILRHMRSVDSQCPNFLDKTNFSFKQLHAAIDNFGRQLRLEGIGTEVKHASIISPREENYLWEAGVLGVENPKSLLFAVFYCNGKNFCLRGGAEHRRLKLSQLQRLSNPDRYIYTEHGSSEVLSARSEVSVTSTLPSFLPLGALKTAQLTSIMDQPQLHVT